MHLQLSIIDCVSTAATETVQTKPCPVVSGHGSFTALFHASHIYFVFVALPSCVGDSITARCVMSGRFLPTKTRKGGGIEVAQPLEFVQHFSCSIDFTFFLGKNFRMEGREAEGSQQETTGECKIKTAVSACFACLICGFSTPGRIAQTLASVWFETFCI